MHIVKPKPKAAAGEGFPDLDPDDYEAFKCGSLAQRFGLLLIRRGEDFLHSIAAHELTDITAHPRGLAIGLITNRKAVALIGANMLRGFFDMQNKKCAIAREYDPERWPRPDPSLPIVTKIKFFNSAKDAEFEAAITAETAAHLVS